MPSVERDNGSRGRTGILTPMAPWLEVASQRGHAPKVLLNPPSPAPAMNSVHLVLITGHDDKEIERLTGPRRHAG